METVIDIIFIVMPIVILGAIVIFVIQKLKGKQQRGELGKRESVSAQTLLDSMIPLGMIFGSALGIVFSMLFPFSFGNGITFGAGLGFLGGYFAYDYYSKQGETHNS